MSKSKTKVCNDCVSGMVDCFWCDGEGIVDPNDKVCPNCNGKGWVKCPECRGSGLIKNDEDDA